MITEEEKVKKIQQAFFEYAKENELSAFHSTNFSIITYSFNDSNLKVAFSIESPSER